MTGLRQLLGFAPSLLFFDRDGTRLFIDGPRRYVADVASGRTHAWSKDRFWRAAVADRSRFPGESDPPTVLVRPDGYIFGMPEGSDVRILRLEGALEGVLEGIRTIEPYPSLEGLQPADHGGGVQRRWARLATGSQDGTARVWNVTSGDVVFTSPVERSDVDGIAFNADESRVTVIYSNGRIIVHAIALEDVIEFARARLTRGFTDEECRTYLHVSACPAG